MGTGRFNRCAVELLVIALVGASDLAVHDGLDRRRQLRTAIG